MHLDISEKWGWVIIPISILVDMIKSFHSEDCCVAK